jgi:hypothetical protein
LLYADFDELLIEPVGELLIELLIDELLIEEDGVFELLIEEVGDPTELMPPESEVGDETLLIEPELIEEVGDPTELMPPESEVGDETLLIEPSMDLLVGVGTTTTTGVGAGSRVPGIYGAATGDEFGAGTIPEQQSRKMPSVVGQHSPINPNEAQTG